MFNYLQKKGTVFAILVLGLFFNVAAQPCDGQEENLLDTQIPVTGISSANPEAYCLYFRFDSDVTGMPIGITMDLWHEYEGDLGIFVEACGERLNVLQRPGAEGNCDAGCSGLFSNCGSSEEIGTQDEPEIINFFDFGPEPDNGISNGGDFGLTLDDSCMVSTLGVNSFAELWSNCPAGLVEAEICFTDHAFRHRGYVSNLNFIFPNPYVCGCMDPDAVNYNPDASVSSGDCIYECPDFDLLVPILSFSTCSGGDTLTLSATASMAVDPRFEWIESGGNDFLEDFETAETALYLPPDFVGDLSYTLIVTDAYGCQEFEMVTVTVTPGPNVQLLGGGNVCGLDSTLLQLVGDPLTSIEWSNGATVDSIRVGPGTYSVSITDRNGCSLSLTTDVIGLPLPDPQITGPDTICYGSTATLSVDSVYASYFWSTSSDTTFITTDSVGNYSITVIDDMGCLGVDTFALATYDSLVLQISGAQQFCAGDSITLVATPGFEQYLWSTGDTTASITVHQAGNYTLVATAANTCTVAASILLTQNELPTPTIIAPLVLCTDSIATLSLSEAYLSYSWSGGATTSTITTDSIGTYSVTVTDSLGCSGNSNYTIDPPAPINLSVSGDSLFCIGDSTLLIATPGFVTYQWSNGALSDSIHIDQAGFYSLTVTNSQGCGATVDVNLSNHPVQTPTISGDNEICAGTSTTLSAAPGFSNYQWSTGASSPGISADTSGTYHVEAIDNNGCLAIASFDLLVRPLLEPQISGDLLLCENTPGVLHAPSGYSSYLWTGGSNADSLVIVAPGTYGLTVTDDLNCTGSTQVNVQETILQPVISGNTTFCFGESTLLSVADTFQTYQWLDGPASNVINITSAGTYELMVTNSQGCTASTSVVVNTWNLPEPEITGDLSFCVGGNTLLDGGGIFATYQWNIAGENNQQLTATQAGDYSLTVTDTNGCQGSDTTSLMTLPLPIPVIVGELAFCPDGSTLLSSQDEYANYSWSSGEQTDQITFAEAASVGLTVTDANNCSGSTSVQTSFFSTNVPAITGATIYCEGGSTSLSASPGFSSYEWSDGQEEPTITTAQTGMLSVTVTDANNCQTENTVELDHFAPPVLAIIGPAGLCEGGNTTLSVVDTFQTYLWQDDSSNNILAVTEPGTYSLTVTTLQGCEAITSQQIESWSLPEPEITGLLNFCEGENTSLDAGDDYNSYQWDIAGQNEQLLITSEAGDYSLTVTDSNGCQGSDAVSVVVHALPEPVIEGQLVFCPEGGTILNSQQEYISYNWSNGEQAAQVAFAEASFINLTVIDENNCSGTTSVETSYFDTTLPEINGNTVFCVGESTELIVSPTFATYSWSDGQTGPSVLSPNTGILAVTVSDENNCLTENTIELSNYEPAVLAITGPEGFCVGDNANLVVVDTFTNYLWSNGEDTPAINVDTDGSYTLVVTDNNGCLAYDTTAVTIYDLPQPQINGLLSFCTDNSTTITAVGGNFASYNWSNGSTDPAVEIATEGMIGVTVTDTNGCTNSTVENITEVIELSPQLTGDTGFCPGETAIIRTLNEFDTYLWSDGTTADSLLVSAAGQYQLTVTNSQGCIGTGLVEVVAFSNPELSLSGEPYFCSGEITTLSASSADAVTYQWSDGTQSSSTDISLAGLYSLTVTNSEGCTTATQENVQERSLPEFNLEGDLFFCEDSTTVLQVMPAYTSYNWSTGEITQSISVANSGTVSVVVTDDFGCAASEAMELSEVPNPIAALGETQVMDCAVLEVELDNTNQGDNLSYQWSGPGINSANQHDIEPVVSEAGEYVLILTDTLYGCNSSPATVAVTDLSYDPEVVLSVLNELDCNSSTVLINGTNSDGGPEFVYQWYDANNQLIEGATAPTYQASIAQEYTLQITDTLTSCTASASIIVDTDEIYPLVDAGPDSQLDCGQPLGTLNGTVIPNEDYINLQWTGPDGSLINPGNVLSIEVDQVGWYYLQATDENNGCTQFDSVLVTEDFVLPTAFTSGDVSLLCNEDQAVISGQGSSVGVDFQYQWLFNGEEIPNANSLQWQAQEPGIYTLLVLDESNECSEMASLELSLDPSAPQDLEVLFTPPTCAGDMNGSIQVSTVSGGLPPYTYSLSEGPFLTNAYFNGLGAGNYTLALEDANGCQLSAELFLDDGNELSVDLGEDQVVKWGEEADIYPFVSIDSSEISLLRWQTSAELDCPDCLYQLDLLLDESTRFFLYLTDENGCTTQDDVTIYVEKERNIFVPNAFSPNGDGTNDIFYIFTDQRSVKEIHVMKIFNRWGEHIFENYNFQPNDPREGWNGRMLGEQLNPAVFVWFAEVELIDGQIIKLKGDVTLVR